MRVLQILPELNVGGVETGTVDFAGYLLAHGHHAVVVSNGGALVRELEKTGVKHYTLPVHRKSLWSAFKCIRALTEIIKDEHIDIVHARSRVPAWIAYVSSRRTQAEFITTCHGYYQNYFLSQVMGWAKLVIVPSAVIGRHMIDDFKVPAQNIRRIVRSVDLDKFRNLSREAGKDQSRPVIAIIGRITPLKGHPYFFKAMAQVVRSMPYAKIWVIGDVPPKKESYKEELQLLVKRLGLTEQVEFLGNRRDIPQLLSQIDVLVLSTVTQEAFGRVILEAQAAGVPVVATQVGGVVDIIDDGITGLLVLPKDPDGMAQAVLRYLRDQKFTAEVVKAARKKLKECFTLEHMASMTVSVYEELLSRLNILVIKLSSVGDVILVTASLKAIRKRFPKAKITCLVGKESRKVLQRCPYVDELIIYDRQTDGGVFGTWSLSRRLRKHKFDKVIDFQNNRKSHWLAFLSFPRESYGYDNGKWGRLLSHKIKTGKTEKPMPPVEHQFQVLKMLEIDFDDHARLELWPSQQDHAYAKNLLDSEWMGNNPAIVGINIAASARWPTKNWPLEYIARLCDILGGKNVRVLLTGMEKDKSLVRELLKLTKTKPADFVGKTDVMQLAALIKRCDVYLSPDSAPMHVAAAMGVPFIAFFGPTDPQRHLPPARHYTVLRRDLSCSPCYSSRCRILTHACMKDITPEEVAGHVMELMDVKK